MRKLNQSLFVVLMSQALMPLAGAQTLDQNRNYGIGLGVDAARTWSEGSAHSDSLRANGTLLFLNRHFHGGPTLNYSRIYSPYYQMTSVGLGLTGKWTYEDIQTADRTPFVELSGLINKSDGENFESGFSMTEVGVGYEVFLNQYVSLAPSLIYMKTWNKSKNEDEFRDYSSSYSDSSARMHLGVNVYL